MCLCKLLDTNSYELSQTRFIKCISQKILFISSIVFYNMLFLRSWFCFISINFSLLLVLGRRIARLKGNLRKIF